MAASLYGLKAKEPPWNLTKEEDHIQMVITLEGRISADTIIVDIVDGIEFELDVKGLYKLAIRLPAKVKDEEKDGVTSLFSKKDSTLTIKMPLDTSTVAAPPSSMMGMDPEEAMMMGMDPDEMEMMGMGNSTSLPGMKAASKKRRLSVEDIPVARSVSEVVTYYMMRREAAGKQRCPHIQANVNQPAGWLDIKLKKMFRECRCKSRSHMWCCLSCYEVHCSGCGDTRTAHYKKMNHGISMNCKCETWCWECAHDPIDERIAPIFQRIYALKHGKKPADLLESLELCQPPDLRASVAHLLGTRGELGEKFKDFEGRMSVMNQAFDAIVTDLSSVWGNYDDWEEEAGCVDF